MVSQYANLIIRSRLCNIFFKIIQANKNYIYSEIIKYRKNTKQKEILKHIDIFLFDTIA